MPQTPHNNWYRRALPRAQVIANDFGGAFCIGAVGGSIYHGLRALKHSTSPINIIREIGTRAPASAGSFGVWGGLFSALEAGVKGVRGSEDAHNAVISGFLTGGILSLRRGVRAAGGSAVRGAVVLAVVEGAGVGLDRVAVCGVLGGGAGAAGGLMREVGSAENFTFC